MRWNVKLGWHTLSLPLRNSTPQRPATYHPLKEEPLRPLRAANWPEAVLKWVFNLRSLGWILRVLLFATTLDAMEGKYFLLLNINSYVELRIIAHLPSWYMFCSYASLPSSVSTLNPWLPPTPTLTLQLDVDSDVKGDRGALLQDDTSCY